VSFSELVFTPTGHGADNQGCSEFCERSFSVESNGQAMGSQSIWKDDCGSNALFPQPGTWLYNRANWCPGEQTPKFRFDLSSTLTNGTNTVDVDFDYHTTSGGASYTVDGYVATYGEFNFTNNIAITDILAPTSKFDHSRFNPHCGKPQIEVQNLGGENLTSFNVTYSVDGLGIQYYNWEGNLAPMGKLVIELPEMNPFDLANPNYNTFLVKLSSPNGETDEDLTDNRMSSKFEHLKDFPTEFIVRFKANSQPQQNSWHIKNTSGDVIYSESGFEAGQTESTTVTLEPGCYIFTLNDSGDNGLGFWANNEGNGSIQFRKSAGGIHKTFNRDFGSQIVYPFTVGVPLGLEDVDQGIDFSLTPNPSSGLVNLQCSEQTKIEYIQVVNTLGQKVLQLNALGFIDEKNLDLSHLSDGIYHVTIQTETQTYSEKVILQN
ncbi:MAG: peptide-N-glycosidase F-related protein, partial [Flavobacteriales bacterium]